MKNMKKIIQLLIITLIIFLPVETKALSVDKNNLTIEKGKNEIVSLYAEVESEITEIQFTMVYTTYDIPAYYNVEAGLTDANPNGISHKIIFSNPVSGKIKLGSINTNVVNNPKVTAGSINIHSAKATTTNNTVINLDAQTINVTIGEKKVEIIEEPPKKNLLDRIESEIVKIEIKEDIYEYKVNIKDDIEELDLKAVPKDETYQVEISNQKISELQDNKIIITIKTENNTEEYIVKVNKLNKVEDIEIDKEEFAPTYKYKGKWVIIIIILSVILFIGLVLTKKK